MSGSLPSLYTIDGPPFISHFREQADVNRTAIRSAYAEPLARSEALLNAYHEYSCQHVWTFNLVRPDPSPTERLLFSAVHKNQIALFAILEMTLAGFFGPVRPLLRQVYEAQLIAKFVATTSDSKMAETWAAGDTVAVGRSVLPRISRTISRPLIDFWKVLHRFVHATPSSQQVSLYVAHNLEEIGLDLMLLTMLLHNQFHLIDRHAFAARSRRYASRYAPPGTMAKLRRRIRVLLKEDAASFSAEGKALVHAFRTRWA